MILYKTIGNFLIRPGLRIVYRAEVAGRERIPRTGPCIVVANHESMFDPFVLGLEDVIADLRRPYGEPARAWID